MKFAANILEDKESGAFHFDYLLAAVTAMFWIRCVIQLRLTEVFGPLLVMIWNMILIITKFLVLYVMALISIAAIATLTLSADENYKDIFNSTRTYFETSLGNFDLRQYDEIPGWERYYALGLHVLVLMLTMLIMVNLLIAILSDEYASLSEVRRGLYWSNIISEMPKYRYDKHYGVLTMVPFPASWLSVLSIPCLCTIKDRKKLANLNQVLFRIVFAPISLIVLAIFMAVNMTLLPFAYMKTLVHKILLMRKYKSKTQIVNFLIFFVLGIPMLTITQITDAVYFMKHTYSLR